MNIFLIMSLYCSHNINNNVKNCCSDDVLVSDFFLSVSRSNQALCSASVVVCRFLGVLQSGSTAGSWHLPLLLCTLAVRSKRAQREHGGVRENTNRAPIVPDLGSAPYNPTSRGLGLRE